VKKHHGDGHITFKSEAKNIDEMEHCLEFARGLGYSSPTPKRRIGDLPAPSVFGV
jgi:hypothetical protein